MALEPRFLTRAVVRREHVTGRRLLHDGEAVAGKGGARKLGSWARGPACEATAPHRPASAAEALVEAPPVPPRVEEMPKPWAVLLSSAAPLVLLGLCSRGPASGRRACPWRNRGGLGGARVGHHKRRHGSKRRPNCGHRLLPAGLGGGVLLLLRRHGETPAVAGAAPVCRP